MKLALITYDFYPNVGGVANVLLNIYNELSKEGHTIYVFNHFYKNKKIFRIIKKVKPGFKDIIVSFFQRKFYKFTLLSFRAIIREKKIPISHRINMLLYLLLNPRKLNWTIDNLIRIYPYFKKIKFDVILGGSTRWCLPLNYIISRIFNKKVISIAYGSDFLIGKPQILKSAFYKNLDKVIVICNQMRLLIMKTHFICNERIEVIPVGVNIDDLKVRNSRENLRKKYNIDENQFTILCVGRHNPRKRFDLVIRAVESIRNIRPSLNLKCFLIGEGQQTQILKKLMKNLKLDKEIEFLGFCDQKIRNEFFKLSDVFIMPSISTKYNVEGFGIVFLEANYHNVPVIGTRTGGILDAIIDKETGLLIQPNNMKDVVEKILYLHDNTEERRKIGENGHNRVISDFIWDKIIPKYIILLEDIVSLDKKNKKIKQE